MDNVRSLRAITLLELLMASVLLGLVVVTGSAVTHNAINAQKKAEESAIFSFAEVAQGIENVFQRVVVAQNFSLPSSSEVRFTRNDLTGRIYSEGDRLVYQRDINNPSEETVILENIKEVDFSLDSLNRLIVEIEMADQAKTKIRTAVRTRNPYEPQVVAPGKIN